MLPSRSALFGTVNSKRSNKQSAIIMYDSFLVYCRELAPGTVGLTGDQAQGDDSKHDLHYTLK